MSWNRTAELHVTVLSVWVPIGVEHAVVSVMLPYAGLLAKQVPAVRLARQGLLARQVPAAHKARQGFVVLQAIEAHKARQGLVVLQAIEAHKARQVQRGCLQKASPSRIWTRTRTEWSIAMSGDVEVATTRASMPPT